MSQRRTGTVKLKYLVRQPLQYGLSEEAELSDPELPRYVRITDLTDDGQLRADTLRSIDWDIARGFMLTEGDLLFARSGATVGKTALYNTSWGKAAFAGYLIRASLDPTNVDFRFVYHYTCSSAYWGWIRAQSTQATIQNVGADKYANLEIPDLPLSEQKRVAAFLDNATSTIDRIIAKKQRLIELLDERRTSLISQMVTQGIDPGVPMKDSGVPWLGFIPAHWAVRALKVLIVDGCINGAFKKSAEFGTGTLFINVSDLYSDDFEITEAALERVAVSTEELARYNVEQGDIFFVRSSLKLDGVGRSAMAGLLSEPAIFDCHLVRVRPKNEVINSEFLIAYLNSALVRGQLVSRANLVTMATLDQDKISTLPIVVPPPEEQAAIVNALGGIWISTSQLTSKLSSNIDRLREYRSALITVAVTGQLDIRDHEKKMEALS